MANLLSMQDQIQEEIGKHPIILFMKGEKDAPMCGFSSQVIHILNQLNVDYQTRNVLENDQLRQSIKIFSNWPTLPQLFVHGHFVGGCDIVSEMYESGELQELIQS